MTLRWILAVATGASALAAEGSFERTVSVSGPAQLEARSASGRISVRGGSGSSVRVHASIRAHNGSGGDADRRIREIESAPPVEQSGGTIRVGYFPNKSEAERKRLERDLSISYDIEVPEQCRVTANTGSGGVTVEGVKGPVNANSGSGSLTLQRIGGEARAHTGSGAIAIDSIQGGVDAETGSGAIRAVAVSGPIAARTGSGGTHLDQSAPGKVRAESGSGGLHVKLASAGYDLDASTGSGKITVDAPFTVNGSIDKRNVRGKVRDGGYAVELRTGSGGIEVR
jgi:hypothetical protein